MALTQCETCGRFVLASRHQCKEAESWDSKTSSASTETPQTSDEPSKQSDQSPAPTTEQSSSTDQTVSGSVLSTVGETTGPPAEGPPVYEDWNKDDLQDELAERDLPISGNKPELIERLKAHDAEQANAT